MTTPNEKMGQLLASPKYAKAVESYTNRFVNGAGLQKPGSVGFALWLLYSNYLKATGMPPPRHIAIQLAKDHGLNTTSATNALGKWSAYHGFRPPRTGSYSEGPL